MTTVSQKEAVYNAVNQVLLEQGISVAPGIKANDILSAEQKRAVREIVFQGFKSGLIALETNYESDDDLRSYVSGLVNNWLRKDQRLNGGEKYEIKNKGIRAGSSDPQVKAMRALLSTLESDEDRAVVQAEIDKRLAEIRAEKAKKQEVVIDVSALPEHLKKFVG